MLEETLRLTVGDTIAHILPMGSMGLEGDEDPEDEPTDDQDDRSSWRELPIWPTDLFVAVAHLVHVSGLLTYFDPDPDALFRPNDRPLCFTLTHKERVEAQAAGKQWAKDPTPSQTVNRLWAKVVGAWEERIRASAHFQNARRRSVPTWWKAALQLLIIADEACVGLGAPPTSEYPERWLVEIFETIQAKPFAGDKKLAADAYQARRQRSSFGVDSDPDVACVQPKSRIASVGCSLRNLTKHVAYIPHVGNVRCHWHQPIGSDLPEDRDTLDILLVPLPLTIEDASFHPKAKADPDPSKRPRGFDTDFSGLGGKVNPQVRRSASNSLLERRGRESEGIDTGRPFGVAPAPARSEADGGPNSGRQAKREHLGLAISGSHQSLVWARRQHGMTRPCCSCDDRSHYAMQRHSAAYSRFAR